jgi:hypothetical protein
MSWKSSPQQKGAIAVKYAEDFQRLNGESDDTKRLQRAAASAASSGTPLILDAKTYKVTETIANLTSVNYFTIIGQGTGKTIIEFKPVDADTPLIKMEICKYPVLKDFTIIGNGTKGIGLKLGRYDGGVPSGDLRFNAVSYGKFTNIRTASLKIGIDHDSGWINDFYSCEVRDSLIGLRLHGNAINLYSFTAEANTTGVDIGRGLANQGDQNSTINFIGGCVEVNTVGFKVRFAHDLNLFGMYLESNPGGHMLAGTDAGDSIETINILGGSWHYPHAMVFDRVNTLNIEGLSEHATASPLTITDNVRNFRLPPLQANYESPSVSTLEAVEVLGKNRQSSTPWFATDFSNNTIASGTTTSINLDSNSQITLIPDAPVTMESDATKFLTGKNSVKFTIPAGRTHSGAMFTVKPTYLKTDQMSLKIPIYTSTTLDSFRILIQVRYNLQDNSLSTLNVLDYIPTFAGDYSFTRILGKWMSFVVPINLETVKAQPSFKNIFDIKINVHGVTSTASVGDEWFNIDSIELYPTKYISNPYADTRTLSTKPLELNPTTVNTELSLSKRFVVTQQVASASATNGSIFEDTDGKLKYKNIAGTVTDLTL